MKILDIDMDFFVNEMAVFIPQNSQQRLRNEDYTIWKREQVIDFFEQNLKLSKDKKIRGRIVTHHHEALYYWRSLVHSNELEIPFEVVHIDSHADLGLGYASWIFIFERLLGIGLDDRDKIEEYSQMFKDFKQPAIGDFLLFALAFRWISKLTYICNPNESGTDYIWYMLKDCVEPNNKIQLPFNNKYPASNLNDDYMRRQYLQTAILEPEVDFEIIRKVDDVKYDGEFDIVTFCISPNYTPQKADFIIDIIKEYIDEE